MLMSHSARSASVTGLPSPGRSAPMAVDAPSASPKGMTTARVLRIDMPDLPFGIDGPARDHIHMSHWECGHRDVHLGRAPLGEHLVAGRLNIAGFVPGAALQNHWLAAQRQGMRNLVNDLLNTGASSAASPQLLPPSAVVGYFENLV